MQIRQLLISAAALGAASGIDQQAFAYLDPGTGSMIIQLVLGGLVGLAAIGKLYWHRLKAFFSREPDPDMAESRESADHK